VKETSPYPSREDPVLRRVVVVGTSCSGKTTFAKNLALVLGATHLELDALHWGPNWVPKPTQEFLDRTAEAVRAERWIVEGNYSVVRELVWPRATAIIWLDYSFPLVFRRALFRTVRRSIRREVLYAGNRESLVNAFFRKDSILWWVITTFHRRRRSYRFLRETNRYPNLRWISFRRPAQAESFLRGLSL
jgi:adenylate kinase family enzyme